MSHISLEGSSQKYKKLCNQEIFSQKKDISSNVREISITVDGDQKASTSNDNSNLFQHHTSKQIQDRKLITEKLENSVVIKDQIQEEDSDKISNNEVNESSLTSSLDLPSKISAEQLIATLTPDSFSTEQLNEPSVNNLGDQDLIADTLARSVCVPPSDYRKTQLSLEQLIDELLSTPLDKCKLVDEAYPQRLEESYKMHNSSDSKFDLDLKGKYIFNTILMTWVQGKITKEEAKSRLISLENSQLSFTCELFLERIIFLKRYAAILNNETLPEHEKLELKEALYDTATPLPTKIKSSNSFSHDLFSLQIFFFFNCLPGFRGCGNYEQGFHLIASIPVLLSSGDYLCSPLSFTAFDKLRFNHLNEENISLCLQTQRENKYLQQYTLLVIIKLLGYFNKKIEDKSNHEIIMSTINKFKLDHFTYSSVKKCFSSVIRMIVEVTVDGIAKHPKALLIEKRAEILESCNEALQLYLQSKFPKKVDGYLSIPYFLKAYAIIKLTPELTKKDYITAAGFYRQASDYMPSFIYNAYYCYKKAGLWATAAKTATEYMHYCKKNQVGHVEFWKDESEHLLELSQYATRTIGGATTSSLTENYDIDAIVKDIEGPQDPKNKMYANVKHKLRRRKQFEKHNSEKTACINSTHKATNPSQEVSELKMQIQKKNDLQILKATCTHKKNKKIKTKHNSSIHMHPVVKTVTRGRQKQQNTLCNMDNFNIVGAQGKIIEPYQRLLERYWNPKIQLILNEIRAARLDADINKERNIYSKVMNDERYKTLIGIERIWEECAWTELHLFDDFFRTGILKNEYKNYAKDWLKKAKETYLLPALAHYFGMDEIRADINPDELWRLANELVSCPALKNKDDNNMVRFRLRCLFSSLGHIHSLYAMVDMPHSKKHSDTARKFFDFKNIDFQYRNTI